MFKPLIKADLDQIVDLQLKYLEERIVDKNIKINLSDEAKKFIIEKSYDPTFGARPVKRYMQSTIENLLAIGFIEGTISENKVVNIGLEDDSIVIKR
jgi:ATP-dependent Clp protease ATP-binding subunit ClpB